MTAKEQPVFVYFYKTSGEAIAHESRDDLTPASTQLLFTCPESWRPKNQGEFEAAAAFYGVKHPERMKYWPDPIPF